MFRVAKSLLGVAALAVLATPTLRAEDPPGVRSTQDAASAKGILAELLAIDTTYEKGTVPAVAALRARFLARGFSPEDLVVMASPANPSQSNLIVKLRGHGGSRPLLYLCHLDVVEADPEDWSVPPFAMTEKDGWIYGRGTLDMKGEDANVAAALLRLRREGYVPARDVIVAFTADEERNGEAGVGWLLQAHKDVIDAGLVLNPDAGGGAFRDGQRAFYGVQTSEKVYVTFAAEATNRGGHSSLPRPDNAIYQLTAALNRLAAFKFPIRLTRTVRAFYAKQAQFHNGTRQADMRAVGNGDLVAAEQLAADPTDNAQLRTTCVATMLQAGHAENALPQRARATIQCRMLPGDSQDQVQAALQRVLADPGVSLTVTQRAYPSPESPPSSDVMNVFTQVVHSMWPGLTVMPNMDSGASDSLFTRAAGIPSYGAASIFFDLEDIRSHGKDERIKADRFAEGEEFTYRLMKAFSAPGAP